MSPGRHPRDTGNPLILRDHLAVFRTVLANERTFLSYVRTALTLFVAGATFIKFFDSYVYEVLGWFLMPLGIITLIKGLRSFRKMDSKIAEDDEGPSSSACLEDIKKS